MAHQHKFNLTRMGCLDTNDQPSKPQIIVEEIVMPFLVNGRKLCQHVRKPTLEESLPLLEV